MCRSRRDPQFTHPFVCKALVRLIHTMDFKGHTEGARETSDDLRRKWDALIDELAGTVSYPPGYLRALRTEWDRERPVTPVEPVADDSD